MNISHKFFRDGKEIAVAYLRAGYTPNDYHSEKVNKQILSAETGAKCRCKIL